MPPYLYVDTLHTTRGRQATRKYLEKAPSPSPQRGESYADQWVVDHARDEPGDEPKGELEEIETSRNIESTRSIFEDVATQECSTLS